MDTITNVTLSDSYVVSNLMDRHDQDREENLDYIIQTDLTCYHRLIDATRKSMSAKYTDAELAVMAEAVHSSSIVRDPYQMRYSILDVIDDVQTLHDHSVVQSVRQKITDAPDIEICVFLAAMQRYMAQSDQAQADYFALLGY